MFVISVCKFKYNDVSSHFSEMNYRNQMFLFYLPEYLKLVFDYVPILCTCASVGCVWLSNCSVHLCVGEGDKKADAGAGATTSFQFVSARFSLAEWFVEPKNLLIISINVGKLLQCMFLQFCAFIPES